VFDLLGYCGDHRFRFDSIFQAEVMANAGVQTEENLAVTAISAIPVVGQILGPILGTVLGFIGASHAAAVAKEGAVLNSATPNFLSTVIQTMTALNNGQISESQAIANLSKAQATYESAVSGIIKEDGGCRPPNFSNPVKAVAGNGTSISGELGTNGQCTVYDTALWKNCAQGSHCNASCAIDCGMVKSTVLALTAIIQTGVGSYTIPATPNNGAIAGTNEITLSYQRPNILEVIDRDVLKDFHLSSSVTGGSNVVGNVELAAIFGVAGIVFLFIIVLGHRSATA
jgi:hypothetical protein